MNYQCHFDQISAQLLRHRALWSPAPFKSPHPSWVKAYPQIQSFLLGLSDEEVARYAKDIGAFANDILPIFPSAIDLLDLGKMPKLSQAVLTHHSPNNDHQPALDLKFFKTGIKQRKWQQIQAFEAQIPWSDKPLLEWCSGKGFLAQLYGLKHQQSVHCVEFNQQLCAAGHQHGLQYNVDATFYRHDVLQDDVSHLFQSNPSCVALHACGQLHIALIENVIKHDVDNLAFAPCCYHLIPSNTYKTLSDYACRSDLVLTKEEMRLALEEHVTGTQAELNKQQRLQQLRLAFDQFCRAKLHATNYTPTPPLAQSWAKKSDDIILNHLANYHQLSLPTEMDWQPWINQGRARFGDYQRYSLIRYLFRRLIEVWMVLDRGLALQEAGYNVSIGEFCDYALTPRNLMLVAQKHVDKLTQHRADKHL